MLDTAPDLAAGDGHGAFLITAFAVLALIGVLAWAALRSGGRAGPVRGWRARLPGAGRAFGPIRVAGRAPLEPGHTLYVIEVAGTALLVAAGEAGVHTLARLDGDAVERAADDAADDRPGLVRALWTALARGAGRHAPPAGPEPGDG